MAGCAVKVYLLEKMCFVFIDKTVVSSCFCVFICRVLICYVMFVIHILLNLFDCLSVIFENVILTRFLKLLQVNIYRDLIFYFIFRFYV